jgi:hypothetical protein
VRDLPAADCLRLDIEAEEASGLRLQAIGAFVELLGRAVVSVESPADADWPALAAAAASLAEGHGPLFPGEELGYVRGFAELAATAAAEAAGGAGLPAAATRAELAARAGRLGAIFGERVEELRDPRGETRRLAALFASQAEELRELPVYLQTGREDRAMKAVLLFIEIFNKVIRLMPLLMRDGIPTEEIRVGAEDIPTFYASFNEVLRRLSAALEDKDAVLIGDLAEYEVAPRMTAFFAAMGEALGRA